MLIDVSVLRSELNFFFYHTFAKKVTQMENDVFLHALNNEKTLGSQDLRVSHLSLSITMVKLRTDCDCPVNEL